MIKKIDKNKLNQRDKQSHDDINYTPLMKAVERGHIRTMKFLIEAGANVNSLTNKNGISAFIIALIFPRCREKREEICEYLASKGAIIPKYNEEWAYDGFGGLSCSLERWDSGDGSILKILEKLQKEFGEMKLGEV